MEIIVFPKHVLSEPSRQTGLADTGPRTHDMSDQSLSFHIRLSFGLTVTTDDDELVFPMGLGLRIIQSARNPETRTTCKVRVSRC